MSEAAGLENVLGEAERREKAYDWSGAVECYRRALGSISQPDHLRAGEVNECLGYALYMAARQADNSDDFRRRIGESIESYQVANRHYDGLTGKEAGGRALRSLAMIGLLGYWLASEPSEKKRLVNDSWRLAKEALKTFEEAGAGREYGRTYNHLQWCAYESFAREWSAQAMENLAKEAMELGEQAIRLLSTTDPDDLATAYTVTASWQQIFGTSYVQDLEEQKKYSQTGSNYWKKAIRLSEETALLTMPEAQLWRIWELGSEEILRIFQRSLEHAEKARDRLLVGFALDKLATMTFWKEIGTEDTDQAVRALEEALKYAEQAKRQYSPLIFKSADLPMMWPEEPHDDYYLELARLEIDLEKRRELLKKAMEAARDHLKLAEDSGCSTSVLFARHVFSKIAAASANLEPIREAKKKLLEEALTHRTAYMTYGKLFPYDYWDLGVGQNYLANIKSGLANLEDSPENRKNLLRDAILSKENCLKLNEKERGSASMSAWVGERWTEYGDLLLSLYQLTRDSELMKRAAEAFDHAAELFQEPRLVSRMAECYWRAGQAWDVLGEYLRASEKFFMASTLYKTSAEKMPRFGEFYKDHASYMEAWGDIEKARYHHGRQEYGEAEDLYERASNLHRSTKQWIYLASNYSALAQLEKGEDLSRRENSRESIVAFREAARLFGESNIVLQAERVRIDDEQTKRMVASLIAGVGFRSEYCMGRVALEEARLLDREGEHYRSAGKYGQAAETFARIASGLESEQDKREIRLVMTLSRAWQMMARAEEETSPELYLEASQLFEEARGLSPSEKARALALGYSRFCRALEAGTRFADMGDPSLHVSAVEHLASASMHFLKAGLQNLSEYADASKLLFDAYAYMDEANREKDHEKRTRFFMLAEKVLESSAETYLKAENAGKREQVTRLLEKVRKERELAVSLTQVFQAPSVVSFTSAFSAPTPTREAAVGLERFEYADVQASLIAPQTTLRVGEDMGFEIELVNAGKGPAQLVKLEEVVPEGFEIRDKPETYRVEDSYLSMRGKRLGPLKTEEVKLVLRPMVQGQFTLKPRVLYLDESGKYKSHEPNPIEITVKELGISGWLKGR